MCASGLRSTSTPQRKTVTVNVRVSQTSNLWRCFLYDRPTLSLVRISYVALDGVTGRQSTAAAWAHVIVTVGVLAIDSIRLVPGLLQCQLLLYST